MDPADRQPGARRRRWPPAAAAPLGLLAAGLLFWAVFLPQAGRSVFGRVPILDEVYYLDRAAGEAPDAAAEPYFMSPLYPLLIRLAGSAPASGQGPVFAPADLRGIRLLQAMLWLATVLLLWRIADRELAAGLPPGRWRTLTALAPPLLFALYRPAAVYAVSIMLEIPLVFCLTAILALLPGPAVGRRSRAMRWLLIGVLTGLGGLLRGTFLVLIPVLAWAGWRRNAARGAGGGRWAAAALLAVGCGAALSPAILHNSRLTGRLEAPTLNGGVNLYIGNGPDANGFYVAAVPGDWRRDPAGKSYLAERLDRPAMSLAQADSVWSARALGSIRRDPGRAFGLWLRKVWLHVQGWEIDQLTPLAAWPAAAPVARLLPIPFAVIAAVALCGAMLMAFGPDRRPEGAVVWLLLAGALIAGQSLFFVVSRYRLVLVPLLALLAGAAVRRLASGPPPGRRLLAAAILVPLLATVPWGLGGVRSHLGAMALANEARRWAELGESGQVPAAGALARAEQLYREALDRGADGPAPWLGLAGVLAGKGQEPAAEQILRAGLDAVPGNLDLGKALVSRLLTSGRTDQALPLALGILEAHPRDADTLHNAAVLLAGAGRLGEALARAEALAALHPQDVRGYIDRGVILARLGRPAAAAAAFGEGLARHPEDPDLTRNLEILEARSAP